MSSRVIAGAVLATVFALGSVAGIAWERHGRAHGIVVIDGDHESALAELRDLLGLDDDQVAAIEAVMARSQGAVQRQWEQLRPSVQAAMRDVHRQIADLLTPEQRERYHVWLRHRADELATPRH